MAQQQQQPPVMTAEDFLKTLDIFKSNFVQYRTLGTPTYDSARSVAQTSIDRTLANLRANVEANNAYIAAAQIPDQRKLDALHAESQKIKKRGPAIQDAYATEKKRKNTVVSEVDYTPYYVKGAIVAVLMGISALV